MTLVIALAALFAALAALVVSVGTSRRLLPVEVKVHNLVVPARTRDSATLPAQPVFSDHISVWAVCVTNSCLGCGKLLDDLASEDNAEMDTDGTWVLLSPDTEERSPRMHALVARGWLHRQMSPSAFLTVAGGLYPSVVRSVDFGRRVENLGPIADAESLRRLVASDSTPQIGVEN